MAMLLKKRIETEVCAYSIESCRAAFFGGATRVELCSGQAEGGTTPSSAAIRMAREIKGLELGVMIRPRGGDFLYSDIEFEGMKRDVEYARECGADGVVFGLLQADGYVDVSRTSELVDLAGDMEVTFHRAFDMTCDWRNSLEAIIASGCTRVLTSGCRNKAMEGIDTLREIVKAADGRIEVMAGSGVNSDNALTLAGTGVDALHFSARQVRDSLMNYRNPVVSMGGNESVGEYDIAYSDEETIRKIVHLLKK